MKLQASANAASVSLSRYLVRTALHHAATRTPDALAAGVLHLKLLKRQLIGMSTNLNQLAHHANATQNFPRDIAPLRIAISRQLEMMDRILTRIEGAYD